MPVLLGLDLGTTAVKAGVFDETGVLVGLGSSAYDLLTPGPGLVELPASVYRDAVTSAIREAVESSPGGEIAAVGVCSQGETFVPLDAQGRELRNFITWLDARAVHEARELTSQFDPDAFYRRTGLPGIDPSFNLPKLLWLRRNEPHILDQAWKLLQLPDYIIFRLTGELASNESAHSTTGYLDIAARDWWDDALALVGVSRDLLPPVVSSGTIVGTLLPPVAEEIGLSPGIPIVSGPMDQAAGAVGAGNIRAGMLTETTGGALAAVATTDSPTYDPLRRVPIGIHGVPAKYSILTYSPTGGMVFKWLRDTLACGDYDALTASAADVPAGSDGVTFLPHMAGMVVPKLEANARGAILGLSLSHRAAHIARAALESVAFMLREQVDLMEEMGVPVRTVRSLGGGAKSDLWLQMKADVLDRPVETVACSEVPALGAALLAGTAVGVWATIEQAVESVVRLSRRFEPSPTGVQAYAPHYERYQEMCRRFYRL